MAVQHAGDARAFIHEVAHTADVGFEVVATTLAGCFERAALALAAVIADVQDVAPRERRAIALEADDLPSLLHDFLHAVLLLAQVDGFLVSAVEVQEVSDLIVRAVVEGEPLDPARHRLRGEVKAITWHGLGAEHTVEGWRARVILDV